jgi:tetratricopeptide (TPR) repeat protein
MLLLLPVVSPAQVRLPIADPMQRALAAERKNSFAEAATIFGEILASKPADAGALFGMERVLRPLDRASELLPLVQKALAVDSNNVGILQVAVRTFTNAARPDLARKYTLRWSERAPDDPSPFEEWSAAASEVRDRATARAALDLGRQRLKDPTALSPDLAQMMQAEGNIAGAAKEWALAVKVTPEYRTGAAMLLGRVPNAQRTIVRQVLTDATIESRQLLGLIELGWGNTTDGTALIRMSLSPKAEDAAALLESAIDLLHGREDRLTTLAKASLLEALAQRQAGADAVRTRLDAARAYADGGAERDARRMLGAASSDPSAPAGTAGAASTAMLGVLIAEGKASEAESVLQKLGPTLPIDDRERETRRVALAFARAGDFAHAETMIAADSSTAGLDLRGRLRLFVGDLAEATKLLKDAGPYDDEREHAVQRVTLLVLLQSAGKDSSRALGTALLALERGDSSAALKEIAELAPHLAPSGAAEAHLLAGQLSLARRDTVAALRFFRLADDTLVPGVAPAARFQVARITAASGKRDEATKLLEQLIVDYPESAVVPEARRFRDTLRGAIPGGGG